MLSAGRIEEALRYNMQWCIQKGLAMYTSGMAERHETRADEQRALLGPEEESGHHSEA